MRKKLLLLVVLAAALQLSCGGALPGSEFQTAGPDALQPDWPDAADLGAVVSSEVEPTADLPPPPDFAR